VTEIIWRQDYNHHGIRVLESTPADSAVFPGNSQLVEPPAVIREHEQVMAPDALERASQPGAASMSFSKARCRAFRAELAPINALIEGFHGRRVARRETPS
jgi:hypothetical protein